MHLRLESFDGPLDLLLHLIKVQEINIFNIPILLITEQYLGFLRQVPELDFHTAGEYLAMAAQLIEIKAYSLLPALQNQLPDAQNLDEMGEEDPRKPLVKDLLEYESIKMASFQLDALKILGRDVFPSGEFKRRELEFEELVHPIRGNSFDLVIAFERSLLRFAERMSAPTVKVRAQKITIHKKMIQLLRRFDKLPESTFLELTEECESRYELIVTFMAMLELAKAKLLTVEQEELFGPIRILPGPSFGEDIPGIEGEEVEDEVPAPVVTKPPARNSRKALS
jgi:segregation and condensation protein A